MLLLHFVIACMCLFLCLLLYPSPAASVPLFYIPTAANRHNKTIYTQGMDQAAALEVLNDMLEQEQLAAVAAAAQRGTAGAAGGPAMSADELRATNPLLMLLQSLLPWVNAGEQPDYSAAAGGAAGAAPPDGNNGGGGGGAGGGEQPPPPAGGGQ